MRPNDQKEWSRFAMMKMITMIIQSRPILDLEVSSRVVEIRIRLCKIDEAELAPELAIIAGVLQAKSEENVSERD